MLNLPIYSKKKLLLALEYAIVLAATAEGLHIEVNKELVERLEVMIVNEFTHKSLSKLALEMIPNIMSVLEPKDK